MVLHLKDKNHFTSLPRQCLILSVLAEFFKLLNPKQMYKYILIVAVILFITHIFYEPSILGIIALLLLIALSIWKIKHP